MRHLVGMHASENVGSATSPAAPATGFAPESAPVGLASMLAGARLRLRSAATSCAIPSSVTAAGAGASDNACVRCRMFGRVPGDMVGLAIGACLLCQEYFRFSTGARSEWT